MANALEIERELDRLNLVISAAEDWSRQYSKDPASHAKLLRMEAKLARSLRKYFRELATTRIHNYVNWVSYARQAVQAFDVKVIFDDDGFGDEDGILLNILHDPLLAGIDLGLSAGQNIYNRQLGLTSYDANVQKAALKYSSKLVTNINDTTRSRIQQSLSSSLSLGESTDAAAERLDNIVNDARRAGVIARTESVNSYGQGLLSFGGASGAVGKVWHDVGADDVCADNSAEGEIGIDETFGSGDDAPAAHPNCRCGLQLIYADGSTDEE